MEAAGIAPASRDPSVKASTCVVSDLIVGRETPGDGVLVGLAHHEFNSCRNGWLGTSDPTKSASAVVRGNSRGAKSISRC